MPRIAIYPGSFDPPTLGHLDIIERGRRLFDVLVVAVGVNTAKSPFLTGGERLEVLRECVREFDNVRVDTFNSLLVDFALSVNATTIIRGLRATSDFDYEFQIASANRRMEPTIETVFLMTKDEHSFLSSSVVREVINFRGHFEGFVPEPVAQLVRRKLGENV